MLMLLIIIHAGSPLHRQITSWSWRFGVCLGAGVFIGQVLCSLLLWTKTQESDRQPRHTDSRKRQHTEKPTQAHTDLSLCLARPGSSANSLPTTPLTLPLSTFHWLAGVNETKSTLEILTPQLGILQEWLIWNQVPGGWGVVLERTGSSDIGRWEDTVWLWVKYDIGCPQRDAGERSCEQ